MNQRMILAGAALALSAAVCSGAAFAQTDALSKILIDGLPDEIKEQGGIARTVEAMLSDGKSHMAKTKPLSQAFDPATALRAMGTRNLTADPSCFRQGAEGGDPDAPNDEDCFFRQGAPSGDGPYVSMRVNLFKGKVAYLNRTRSFLTERNPNGILIGMDAATKYALTLPPAFGIPATELDQRYIDTRGLRVAGADAKEGALTPAATRPDGVLAEVHVRVPRAIPDTLGTPKWPVHDSQFMVAVTGSPGREVAARVRGQWPDFGLLLPAVTPVGGAQLIASMTSALTGIDGSSLEPPGGAGATAKGTRSFIAFVPLGQLEGCRADPGDETGEEGARPQDFRRLYVPALVLYAIPKDPGEVLRPGEKDARRVPSTGIAQMSFPLVDLRGYCDQGGAQ